MATCRRFMLWLTQATLKAWLQSQFNFRTFERTLFPEQLDCKDASKRRKYIGAIFLLKWMWASLMTPMMQGDICLWVTSQISQPSA